MEQIENDGQIKYNSSMGQVISQYANDTRFTNFLEIGTWNGGGSTYCFAKGFEARVERFRFVSLEINEEMFNEAKEKYKKLDFFR
jgi:predicted O-methyltransferase YrrM